MTEDERQKLLGTVVAAHGGLSEVTFKLRLELTPKAPAVKAAVRTNDPEGKRGIVGNVRPIDFRQSRKPSKLSWLRFPLSRKVVVVDSRHGIIWIHSNLQTFKRSKVYIPQHSDFWYNRRE